MHSVGALRDSASPRQCRRCSAAALPQRSFGYYFDHASDAPIQMGLHASHYEDVTHDIRTSGNHHPRPFHALMGEQVHDERSPGSIPSGTPADATDLVRLTTREHDEQEGKRQGSYPIANPREIPVPIGQAGRRRAGEGPRRTRRPRLTGSSQRSSKAGDLPLMAQESRASGASPQRPRLNPATSPGGDTIERKATP